MLELAVIFMAFFVTVGFAALALLTLILGTLWIVQFERTRPKRDWSLLFLGTMTLLLSVVLIFATSNGVVLYLEVANG